MADNTVEKGTDFVSQRQTKNDLFSQRKDDTTSVLNKTMSSFSTDNIKVLNTISRHIGDLNQNIKSFVSLQKKDRFTQQIDYEKKTYETMNQLLKFNMESERTPLAKKGKGIFGSLLGMFGSGLSGLGDMFSSLFPMGKGLLGLGVVGGILGYLLFGQDKFIRGIREHAKKIGGLVKNYVLDPMWDAFTKWWNEGGQERVIDMGMGILDGLGKGLTSAAKWAVKNPKVLAGAFGVMGVAALLSNPAVGLPIMFTAGALTALGLTIKSALDEQADDKDRNVKAGKEQFETGQSLAQKYGLPKELADELSDVMRKSQLLGTGTDAARSILESEGFFQNITDDLKQKYKGLDKFEIMQEEAERYRKRMFNIIQNTGGVDRLAYTQKTIRSASMQNDIMDDLIFGENVRGMQRPFAGTQVVPGTFKPQPLRMVSNEEDAEYRGTEGIEGQTGYGWYTLNDKVDVGGVHPKIWSAFEDMAVEYYDKTGRRIQINSAYRPADSDSLHSIGEALDIQSTNANELEKLGLMESYGFHRPLIGFKNKQGKPETWHVEPYPGQGYGKRNTNNYEFRKDVLNTESGGGGTNIPAESIPKEVQFDKKSEINLSESTIKSLARAMGASFKDSLPIASPNQISINSNMRG